MYRSLIIMLLLSTLPLRADILTLADALQQARQHNPEQAVRNRQVAILEEGVGIARSSYLPRLDLQGGYTAQREPQAVVIGGHPMPTQDRDFLFASASLHQTIYDFGRSSGRYQRSLLLKEAAESDRQAQEQDLFLRVVRTYYGVLEAQSLLAAADDEVKQRQEHLQVATSLYEQGVVTRKDLLQAEVKRAQSQQQQLAMINLQQNQRLLLNYLIGAEATSQAALEPPLPPETALPDATQEQALAQRSEVRQMRQLVAASEEEIKENRGEFLPELFGRLSADYVENSNVKEQTIYAATVGVKVNLFDGLASTARLRQSVATADQNRLRLRQIEEQVRLDLTTAHNDATVAAERISVATKAIESSEENLRINRDRYQEQVGTSTDVIDAQTLLTQARSDYYQALYDYQVALARLKRAKGEL